MNIDFVLQSHGLVSGRKSNSINIPSAINNLTATLIKSFVQLDWNMPNDNSIFSIRIQRKIGSYPNSIVDGITVFNGSGNTFIDKNVTPNETYYYRAFTLNKDNIYNDDESMQISETPIQQPVIYGVKIDTTNSNPETALTYIEEAIGFTPAKGNNGSFDYGSWEDKFPFNQIKPCLLKNGVVNYYLNPNDYTKKLDGSLADITSGNDGDVMIEFPKIYWKFETVGTDLYIRYSDKKIDDTYKCLAHTRGNVEKDKIYLSAYLGSISNSRLRSLSGFLPETSRAIGNFRAFAQIQGIGYEQFTFYQLLMLQVLFIVMFKNRDSQIALGRGYVDGNSAITKTGGTNQKGLFYGETTGKLQNKFCGIEDIWGNLNIVIEGLFSSSIFEILTTNNNFNDTASGYYNNGKFINQSIYGYISSIVGITELGFISTEGNGSATTYYSDTGILYGNSIARFGGSKSDGNSGGVFSLRVVQTVTQSFSDTGSRISFY